MVYQNQVHILYEYPRQDLRFGKPNLVLRNQKSFFSQLCITVKNILDQLGCVIPVVVF